jgi:hypothetical protein
MSKLDTKGYERARNHVLTRARPVDRALFCNLFESGPREDVFETLAAFQNPDGGFGNGLEPDFRLPSSSPMATSVAFQILREVGGGADTDLVPRAVAYLLETYDPERPGWKDVPDEVNDHPHAPWWHQEPGREHAPEEWGNPNAELIGVLLEHSALVPQDLIRELPRVALEKLDLTPSPIRPYLALCYLRFAAQAPRAAHEHVISRLRTDARQILDLNTEKLASEHFHPYWLAPGPEAPLADLLEDAIAWDLDREVARQSEEGFWEPRWTWGNRYPDTWELAREEWRGELTLRTLRALRAYGRIEGI